MPSVPAPAPQPATFYEAVGGEPTFRRIVGRFYAAVAEDDVLRALYPEQDLGPAEERLVLFLMQYWGGPTTYSDERGHPRLRMRHAPFAIGAPSATPGCARCASRSTRPGLPTSIASSSGATCGRPPSTWSTGAPERARPRTSRRPRPWLTTAMSDPSSSARAATVEVVREALRTGDVTAVEDVLAADVHWYGTGPGGGCRTRDEVFETLREAFSAGSAAPMLRAIRTTQDRVVLHVAYPDADERPDETWFVLKLDGDGLITNLQAYSSAAAAEHDLAILSSGVPPHGRNWPATAVSGLVPFVHVADTVRSLAFYRLLGFEPLETHEPGGELVWAFLQSGEASLMLGRAGAPVHHREQAVFFYLYAEDLASLRDRLVAHGVAPGEIVDGSPGPRQEMLVADPDGYVLMIAQIEPAEAPG